jgi:predicted Zn-dependent protease with MMP-like domain
LNNVDVVVADWPSSAELRAVGLTSRWQLLGLYQGVPLTRRTSSYNLVPPDKITLFRLPIERICVTPTAVKRQVRKTVVHELAHHFGISDARLKELGAY